jgi:hypothetical protein
MTEPVPRLRRGPDPQPGNGRSVLIGAAVFFVLLVAFVLVLVFTAGIHNQGVRIPPPPTTTSRS